MSGWYQLLFALLAAVLIWMGYRLFKHNPDMFTKEKFAKTAGVLGVLALVLIGFVALLVLLLKS